MNIKFSIFIVFILTNINFANSEEVQFLLQSVSDPSKLELITDTSSHNILFINSKCEKCFENSLKLSKVSKRNFIVIVGQKPIDNIFEKLKNYRIAKENWPLFYSDTGLRLTNQLKIKDNTSVLIARRKGQTKMDFNFNLSKSIPLDSDLIIWD